MKRLYMIGLLLLAQRFPDEDGSLGNSSSVPNDVPKQSQGKQLLVSTKTYWMQWKWSLMRMTHDFPRSDKAAKSFLMRECVSWTNTSSETKKVENDFKKANKGAFWIIQGTQDRSLQHAWWICKRVHTLTMNCRHKMFWNLAANCTFWQRWSLKAMNIRTKAELSTLKHEKCAR